MSELSTTAIDFEMHNLVDLNETERHALLASDRRRRLIRILTESGTPTSLSDLAEAVRRAESDAADTTAPSTEQLSIELHHNHLPRLAAHSLIDYVPETHKVEAVRF